MQTGWTVIIRMSLCVRFLFCVLFHLVVEHVSKLLLAIGTVLSVCYNPLQTAILLETMETLASSVMEKMDYYKL